MKKKKNKSKIIVIIVVIVLILLFAIPSLLGNSSKLDLQTIDAQATTVLSKSNLVDYISGSGVVSSNVSENIYASGALTVESVNVEVGDYVKKGDVLATLDTTDLEKQLVIARNNQEAANLSSDQTYEQLISALEEKIATYDELNDMYWEAMQNDLPIVSDTLNPEGLSASELLARNNTKRFEAKKALDEVNNNLTPTTDDSKAIAAAKVNAENQVLNSNLSVEALEEQISDATLVAPVDGTVTLVNAKVGEASSGIVFMVEALDDLKIEATIAERDLASVVEGLKVEVSSSTISSLSAEAVVSKIAPTAVKTITSDPEFATTLQVESGVEDLKIGMNVKLKYIISEKNNVIQVPYDAIYQKDNESYVLVMTPTTNDKYSLVETKVTKGISSDVKIEVSGDISEGDRVVNYPDNYLDALDLSYSLANEASANE